MHKLILSSALAVSLTACSDPLSKFDKLSDIEVQQDDPVRVALADPAVEQAESGGVFSRIFSRAPTEASVETAPDVAGEESGQSLEAAPQLDLSQPAVEPQRAGLFSRIFKPQEDVPAVPDIPVEDVAAGDETLVPGIDAAVTDDAKVLAEQELGQSEVTVESKPEKRGLIGLLRRKEAPVDVVEPETDTVVLASLSREPLIDEGLAVEPVKKRRLLGGLRVGPKRADADLRDVSYGMTVPFGEVARVCEARLKPMGRRIEKAGKGKGFVLFDSDPDSTAPRTFYVTGFADGCPRQFTAALALFGAPSMHEQLRYGSPSDQYPYSDTDQAYEKVKSRVCGAARRKPCGSKIKTLERNTVFISTYERFSDNGRWADILLHDGAVMAAAIKAPN